MRACRSALAPTRTRWRRRRSRARIRYGAASFRLPGLAADERLGMALKVVRQYAYRTRREAHLLQRVGELGVEHRVGLDQLVGVVERAAPGVDGAARADQRPIELDDRLL